MKEAFQSAEQLNSFVAMIENRIRMKMTLCNDALIMATICNLIGQKINGGRVVDLLALYNAGPNAGGTALTQAKALTDKEFLRFASKTVAQYRKFLATASTLYNDGSYITFTPEDRLRFIANTEFAKSLDAYLYSDTYHDEFVKLPGYEEVAQWQGSGSATDDRLKIDATIDASGTATEIVNDGILAVMLDRDAAAVCNQNYRITSIYNPRGEYTNFFYKWDAMYMNDVLENVVVFTVGKSYIQDTRINPTDFATAPSNWTTIDDKLFYDNNGVMTTAAGTTYDKDVKYFYVAGDKPVAPTGA